MKRSIVLLALSMIIPLGDLQAAPRVSEIVAKMDYMQEQIGDISVKVSMVQNKARQGVKSYESLFFRRDKTDEFLIVITEPETEKGNGYLRVGDNFWMYRQNTRTFQHISRDESIMGTDTKSGDFEKRKLAELYKPQAEKAEEEMLGKKAVYKFTLVAQVNDVTYPKQVYWVQKDTFIPLKIQSYSLSGTLMQTAYFPKWTQIDGKYMWLQLISIDEFEKGNKTIVELSGISTKLLDPRIFTKAHLENLSK